MSEVQEILKADGGISDLGQVLGTGAGANTGQETADLTNPNQNPPGIGNTFLTEPLHAQFVSLLEEASFVRQIAKTVTMTQPTLRVPAITSGLEVYYHGEQGQEANETTMSAGDFTLEARKIMAQVLATAELYEDSQQNIEQIITGDFVRAIAQAEEQAFLIGRQTAPGQIPNGSVGNKAVGALNDTSGNANTVRGLTQFTDSNSSAYVIDATSKFSYAHWGTQTGEWAGMAGGTTGQGVASNILTSPLQICDGVVTTALDEGNVVDMQGASFQGAMAYRAIREAIFRLGLLGRDRGSLILILNPVASNQLLQSDELMTLDKYGSNATILTGEVGSLFGVKIIESSFMPSNGIEVSGIVEASSSGFAGDTASFGLGGYGVLVHKPSLILGDLRKVQVENERIIQNDAYRTVISERLAFGMERRAGAVAIGNIATEVGSTSSGNSIVSGFGVAPVITSADSAVSCSATAGQSQTITVNVSQLQTNESTSLQVASAIFNDANNDDSSYNLKVTASGVSSSFGTNDFGVATGGGVDLGTVTLAQGAITVTVDVDVNINATTDTLTITWVLFDGTNHSNTATTVVTFNS